MRVLRGGWEGVAGVGKGVLVLGLSGPEQKLVLLEGLFDDR